MGVRERDSLIQSLPSFPKLEVASLIALIRSNFEHRNDDKLHGYGFFIVTDAPTKSRGNLARHQKT